MRSGTCSTWPRGSRSRRSSRRTSSRPSSPRHLNRTDSEHAVHRAPVHARACDSVYSEQCYVRSAWEKTPKSQVPRFHSYTPIVPRFHRAGGPSGPPFPLAPFVPLLRAFGQRGVTFSVQPEICMTHLFHIHTRLPPHETPATRDSRLDPALVARRPPAHRPHAWARRSAALAHCSPAPRRQQASLVSIGIFDARRFERAYGRPRSPTPADAPSADESARARAPYCTAALA